MRGSDPTPEELEILQAWGGEVMVLGPPPGFTPDQVGFLTVVKMPDEEFGSVLFSRWTLSDEERAAVTEGSPVWLGVCGEGHPAVMMHTDLALRPEEIPEEEQ